MSNESDKSTVVRVFMHRDFPSVLMVKFNDESVSSFKTLPDAVMLYNTSELIGVNLLNTPFIKNGFVPLNEELINYIKERFAKLDLFVNIDQKSYFICGRITKIEDHPLLEHLHICTVDINDKDLSIVCSAKNVKEDMLVVVALPNAVLPDGTLICDGKVAGVPSQGMLCSLSEITGGKKPVRGLIELAKGTECGSTLDIAGLGETLC